jgi:tetratricopeptide (TPR) repeat protein
MGGYKEAIVSLHTAIELGADSGECYASLGDAYFRMGENDSAIDAYKTALRYKDAPDWAHLMPGQVYAKQGKRDKALEAYYAAKDKLHTSQDAYTKALYNIGLLEYQGGGYEKSAAAFTELLELSPADYTACAKLVQAFYALRQYDRAIPYKQKMAEAAKKGTLPEKLKDKFCFDQFKIGNKEVMAYERYEDITGETVYLKHVFYVQDAKGNIEYKIQTEYSPYSVATGGAKYMLCSVKNGIRGTYGRGFNDGFNYDDMKKAVMDIVEGKLLSSVER